MTDLRDAEPHPPDDSPGYCCVSAGMHMGHDEDCQAQGDKMIDCTSPGGHRWVPDHYGSGAFCKQDGCVARLEKEDVAAILNAHASLTELLKDWRERVGETARLSWASDLVERTDALLGGQ